jgi:alpha-ribazole phosphatase
VIWSSPLGRCAELAAALADALGAPLRIDERLREISFGAWEGRPWDEIARTEPEAHRRWMAGWRTEAPPGGEPLPAFEARIGGWWRTLDRGADQLLVAHAGVTRALRVLAQRRSWEEALAAAVPHLQPERFPLAAAGSDGASRR